MHHVEPRIACAPQRPPSALIPAQRAIAYPSPWSVPDPRRGREGVDVRRGQDAPDALTLALKDLRRQHPLKLFVEVAGLVLPSLIVVFFPSTPPRRAAAPPTSGW